MPVTKRKKIFRIIAIAMGFVGIATLSSVVYSLAQYKVISNQKFPNLLNPVSENDQELSREIEDGIYDYTKASNWFDGLDRSVFNKEEKETYTISVPKLKIENATVAIGGDDLSKHLIQYPGTALPGKRGNAVIFGHSTLPSLYNPKNYTSIFSTLPTLDRGDEILLKYDGIEYAYIIETMFEVKPTDIQIFEQNISDAFVTLITCTPPGDPRKPKRLVVRARIIPLGEANNENTRT